MERGLRCAEDCYRLEDHTDYRDTDQPPRILMSATDANELLSDATHYSDFVNWSGSKEGFGLQQSARATVRKLEGYARNRE